jgi:hypothetical protein
MIHGKHHRTFQFCIVWWCGLYHLLVGICENGYPLEHIPTNKGYKGPSIALSSTNNCDVVPSSNLHDGHLPQISSTVKRYTSIIHILVLSSCVFFYFNKKMRSYTKHLSARSGRLSYIIVSEFARAKFHDRNQVDHKSWNHKKKLGLGKS